MMSRFVLFLRVGRHKSLGNVVLFDFVVIEPAGREEERQRTTITDCICEMFCCSVRRFTHTHLALKAAISFVVILN